MTQEYILHPAHAARDLHIDYPQELNEQQLAAVTAVGADGSLNSASTSISVPASSTAAVRPPSTSSAVSAPWR